MEYLLVQLDKHHLALQVGHETACCIHSQHMYAVYRSSLSTKRDKYHKYTRIRSFYRLYCQKVAFLSRRNWILMSSTITTIINTITNTNVDFNLQASCPSCYPTNRSKHGMATVIS